ncbi:MAG: hypothetical protein V1797_14050 [Pseudomonadota bacterium]
MPILDLYRKSKDTVLGFSINQVVAVCADGKLSDGSPCSAELREYLENAPTEKLIDYAEQCLTGAFENSGFVLQDIINEIGRRLGYKVSNGLYRGRKGKSGHDGVWQDITGHHLIVEVKTSDSYRVNLDIIASYRSNLLNEAIIDNNSSSLLIVGRADTGDLESQVRGSRHAWDMRIIGIDALIRLVQLKQEGGMSTAGKIHEILRPVEYTRLDSIIDVIFVTVEDSMPDDDELDELSLVTKAVTDDACQDIQHRQVKPPQSVISNVRSKIINHIEMKYSATLIKQGRALFSSSHDELRVVCSISKRYDNNKYWYAFHPSWDEFLRDGKESFFALGCVDLSEAYVLPYAWVSDKLDLLHVTPAKGGKSKYWHVHLEKINDAMHFHLFKAKQLISVSQFRVAL